MKIRCGIHEVVVAIDSESTKRCRENEVIGQFIASDLRIDIDSSYPLSVQRETLIHELLHFAYESSPIRDGGFDFNEELIVNSLTPVVAQALIQNPHLLEWLKDEQQ